MPVVSFCGISQRNTGTIGHQMDWTAAPIIQSCSPDGATSHCTRFQEDRRWMGDIQCKL